MGREQFADGACIFPPHGNAGEDEGAGIDFFGHDVRDLVLLGDERPQRVDIDGAVGGVGRQKDVGLMDDLAFGDHIAVVETLQNQARKNDMRGRRADIDADADQNDFVLALETAARAGEEYPPALVFFFAHARPLIIPVLSTQIHSEFAGPLLVNEAAYVQSRASKTRLAEQIGRARRPSDSRLVP